MDLTLFFYVGLALVYCEGGLHNTVQRDWHEAIHQAVIAVLYTSIAVIVWDPAWLNDLTLLNPAT